MVTDLFVNLPVKDLARSMEFFTKIGFSFNPQFTDENAACLVLGEHLYVMLLVEKFFNTFTPRKIADTQTTAEVINALMVESKAEVDRLHDAAMKAGAGFYRETEDMGFMYGRSFQDPDGHLWEIGWMDPSHLQPQPNT